MINWRSLIFPKPQNFIYWYLVQCLVVVGWRWAPTSLCRSGSILARDHWMLVCIDERHLGITSLDHFSFNTLSERKFHRTQLFARRMSISAKNVLKCQFLCWLYFLLWLFKTCMWWTLCMLMILIVFNWDENVVRMYDDDDV